MIVGVKGFKNSVEFMFFVVYFLAMTQDWKGCYRMPSVAPCRKWDENVCKSLKGRLVLEHKHHSEDL